MEFDWSVCNTDGLTPRDVEESFEDPFSIRIMPEIDEAREARYFILGRAVSGVPIFTVFWTDGRLYRVVFARRMTSDEEGFYERKNNELAA